MCSGWKKFAGTVLMLTMVQLLGGCSQLSTQPVAPAPVVQQPAPRVLTAADIYALKLGYLLDEVEAALVAERLLLPEGDSAADWFRAVLAMAPDNQQALSGLQQIMVHYAQSIRESLAKGETARARDMLQRLQQGIDSNPLMDELASAVTAAEAAESKRQQLVQTQIAIAGDALRQRSPELVTQLQQIAMQARTQDMMLLISVRNDAEGRWIYQQMRAAVPGYRLQADIVQADQPAIALLPSP